MEWMNTGRGFGALIFIEEVHIMMIRTKFLNAFLGILLVMAMVACVGCIMGQPRIDTYTVYEEPPYDLKNATYEDRDILLTIKPMPEQSWAEQRNYDRQIYLFALTITNKTKRDINIDWANIYFINKNGQLDGDFMQPYQNINNSNSFSTNQPLLILANSTCTVELYPNAWRAKLGPIEDGTFGAYISKINGQEKRIKVTVDIGISLERKIQIPR